MTQKTLSSLGLTLCLILALMSCSLPPENAVRKELFPEATSYSTHKEKNYTTVRVYDRDAALGYLLSIPIEDGLIFLKVDTLCMLESALLRRSDGEAVRTHPVYQADWGQSLQQLMERDNLRPAVTHFITNQYRRDLEESQKGSMFSLF